MAPGLGLSAFFTYGLVVKSDPTTAVSWQKAIGYVGISGVAMVILSITFLVERSMKHVPNHIKLGTIIGIGKETRKPTKPCRPLPFPSTLPPRPILLLLRS